MSNKLRVQNFRKHLDYEIEFQQGVNMIVGLNGSGKTSLIEAIYIASQGKSWRSNFDDIKTKNSDWWRVDYQDRVIKYNNQEKEFIINNKSFKSLRDIYKNPIILFEPQDLNLLYRSPSCRRNWLDNFITNQEPKYRKTINKYNRILKQRNSLLKNQSSKEQLFVWDIQFASTAALIIKIRKKYINIINKRINQEYKKITQQNPEIILEYKSEIDSEQAILNTINNNYQYEIISGYTSIGPHQHDIIFYINNKNATGILSRGENRSLILALKYVEYDLKKDSHPLILLDDIMSEFDCDRQKNIIDSFHNEQVIITGVNKPDCIKDVSVVSLTT